MQVSIRRVTIAKGKEFMDEIAIGAIEYSPDEVAILAAFGEPSQAEVNLDAFFCWQRRVRSGAAYFGAEATLEDQRRARELLSRPAGYCIVVKGRRGEANVVKELLVRPGISGDLLCMTGGSLVRQAARAFPGTTVWPAPPHDRRLTQELINGGWQEYTNPQFSYWMHE